MTGSGRLRDLLDEGGLAERLSASAISADRVSAVRNQFAACVAALRRAGVAPHAAAHAFVVPGRIEVLGKHTDYGGGRSILAAPERGVAVVAVPRGDRQVCVRDVGWDEEIHFSLESAPSPVPGWPNYVATAARRLARDFPAARTGADVALTSDLPAAAGMSSSSALVVSSFLALAAVNRLDEDERYREVVATREDLAAYLAAVESGEGFRTFAGDAGVGTEGGSEDHTAMLCARPGRLIQYAFAPVRFERELPLPDGHRFVVASSGVPAEKTGAAREGYNRAARLLRAAAALWRDETGHRDPTIGAVLDAGPEALARLRRVLAGASAPELRPEALLARLEHFVAEDREIVPAAGDALLRGDLAAFGAQVDRSQALADRLLGNQTDETRHLARTARELGAAAASAFGAGFGGSVWALAADATAEDFRTRWREAYLARFPERRGGAIFFGTRAGPPMARIL